MPRHGPTRGPPAIVEWCARVTIDLPQGSVIDQGQVGMVRSPSHQMLHCFMTSAVASLNFCSFVEMCDRRILSSDPHDWDELIAESTGAERYSRRLAERIADGYASKFQEHADQAGLAPLGFRRSPESPYTLEIDPATIGQAVALYERYALGAVSMAQLTEETGLALERVRKVLRNPLYNGWVRRHRGPLRAHRRRGADDRGRPADSGRLRAWSGRRTPRRG